MKRAFDHCAADYARHRPSYPDALLDRLSAVSGPPRGRLAADVGAGTGILSRQLAARGWNVVAVEPSISMLKHSPAQITRLCARAEHTALANSRVTLVTAAQAFHWFNPPHALNEFARLLEPGGVLALCWNNRDATRSSFVEQYESLIARYNPAYRRDYRQQDWAGKIAASGHFASAEYHVFDHIWAPTAEGLLGFTRSVSYVRNVLSEESRRFFEKDLQGLIDAEFGTRNCHIPLRTDLWTARRAD